MEGRAWAAFSVGANSRYSCWKDDLGVLKCKLLLSYLSYKGFFGGWGAYVHSIGEDYNRSSDDLRTVNWRACTSMGNGFLTAAQMDAPVCVFPGLFTVALPKTP